MENPNNKAATSGVPTLHPRLLDIIAEAREAGRVTVEALAEKFDVTPQTIRKDLNELCEFGHLQRVHGGAVLASGLTNLGHAARRQLAADAKRRIGATVASMIPNNASILINIGTTTEQVAMALRDKREIMVITNNINVINILSGHSDIDVIVVPGNYRHADAGVIGEAAADFIRQFKVDFSVIGASAIDSDGSLLDYDYQEVKVARAIIENSRHTILAADAMKLQRSAPVRIAHLSQVDTFVTDEPLPKNLTSICKDNDVSVILADS
ncbi:MAG: DeoR/GlpR transcriptional regulator [Rhodospirillales bacterium]|nr:DeoR/GlpR transcriptional regulator [Rhodospirillales bacterium]MBO6785523.1 DeoR/GlpR transcriptional regulator [Rhodospirillales bacterium]